MPSDSLRRRLEALNRERLPPDAPTPRKPPTPKPTPKQAPVRKDLLDTGVVCENSGGEHLVIPIAVNDLWPGGEERVAARLEFLRSLPNRSELSARLESEAQKAAPEERAATDSLAKGFAPFVDAMPDRTVMLDLETCGLSGSALFLVGLLRVIEGRLTVELLFARNYSEERAVMVSLWARLNSSCDVVVTFNGKSFDWPMVIDRSRRHLLHKEQRLTEPHHLDVLHAARRRWRRQLPDCKLQTIERLVCRRPRTGDIPGSQIPAAYDAYVRTGRPHEMELVLNHNALDLVTLLDIAMRVAI